MATDISKMDLQQLKSMAYDIINQIEIKQNDLNILNNRIKVLYRGVKDIPLELPDQTVKNATEGVEDGGEIGSTEKDNND